jgi:hypothetical protein
MKADERRSIGTRSTVLMRRALAVAVLFSMGAPAARAATEIGTFVAVHGTVEVRRASAGDWKPATVGAPIYVADEIRTAGDGLAKLFFRDSAVVDLGSDSMLAIKLFDSAGSDNVLSLSQGRLRAFLEEGARAADARFEVETPTAVVRAEGTVFIVDYAAEQKVTRVYGVEGTVEVQGSIGLIGPSLKVGAQEQTRIEQGKFPEPVQAAEAAALAAMTSQLEIIGSGRSDGFAATHPLLAGAITRSDERPAAVQVGLTGAGGDASYLAPDAPGETLLERLSPEARANTQPIPEYEFTRPDRVPPTSP